MRLRTKILLALAGVVVAIWGLFQALALGQVESTFKTHLRCWLSGIPPVVNVAQGPLHVGTDWVTIDLPPNLKRVPFVESVVITLPGRLYIEKFLEFGQSFDDRLPVRHFEKATGQEVLLQVQFLDPQGRGVYLSYTSLSFHNEKNQPSSAEQGYSLTHPGWKKAFFAPDVVLSKVAIRANRPVELQAVAWTASRYCFWPNRDWSDVEESEIYRFEDGPGPLGAKVESNQQGGVE